ncbi:hypothetical protein KQ41_20040 [Lysinibacillus fusiformis]|uniref:hypothetical protein n=1 Tax=Lysinibacillus fusiformis TaxID=28031 RepID=UPI0005026CBE|nr:hypothetical protein [Lysinibacillus fusiformis]KGA81101.1 hypothetical protein KQ41_20040 [Lysinibacillus fusiformis]
MKKLILLVCGMIGGMIGGVLLLIFYGVDLEKSALGFWLSPVATLLGAFLGTWISGRYAIILFEKQSKHTLRESKRMFNNLVHIKLTKVFEKLPSVKINKISFNFEGNPPEKIKFNELGDDEKLQYAKFSNVNKNELRIVFEDFMKVVENAIVNKIIDWDTYKEILDLKEKVFKLEGLNVNTYVYSEKQISEVGESDGERAGEMYESNCNIVFWLNFVYELREECSKVLSDVKNRMN